MMDDKIEGICRTLETLFSGLTKYFWMNDPEVIGSEELFSGYIIRHHGKIETQHSQC